MDYILSRAARYEDYLCLLLHSHPDGLLRVEVFVSTSAGEAPRYTFYVRPRDGSGICKVVVIGGRAAVEFIQSGLGGLIG